MPLFRRKRETKDDGPAGPVDRGAAPSRDAGPSSGAPAARAGGSAGPPPLPAPSAAAPASLQPRPDYSECFVCGSNLEGKTCPKCRMTWIE